MCFPLLQIFIKMCIKQGLIPGNFRLRNDLIYFTVLLISVFKPKTEYMEKQVECSAFFSHDHHFHQNGEESQWEKQMDVKEETHKTELSWRSWREPSSTLSTVSSRPPQWAIARGTEITKRNCLQSQQTQPWPAYVQTHVQFGED